MAMADPRTPSPAALSQHPSLVSVMEIIIFHRHCSIPASSGLLSLQLTPVVPLLRQPKPQGLEQECNSSFIEILWKSSSFPGLAMAPRAS